MDLVCLQAEVLARQQVARALVRLRLSAPEIASRALPGQFVMVGPVGAAPLDPFLPRPYSIHRRTGQEIELLVAERGRGSQRLAREVSPATVELWGPIGRGFGLPPAGTQAVLVAGGVGLAPLWFLAEELLALGRSVELLYGAVTATAMVDLSPLEHAGVAVRVATDDGSAGRPGQVTGLLLERLAGRKGETVQLFACGPEPMLRKAVALAREGESVIEVSLENRMACGTGACMGCALPISGRYLRVCAEGPVFDGREAFP